MRILILIAVLLSLSSCLATPRFFPKTYEDDAPEEVVKPADNKPNDTNSINQPVNPKPKKKIINQYGIETY